jgi:cytochrome P450
LLGSARALAQDILGFLLDMGRSYGDVAYARVGISHLYMLNDPALIEDVLVGKHRDCIKDLGTRELIPLVGQGLLTSEGEHWRRQRKLAAPPLQPKRIASYAQTMVECAEREIDGFRDGEVRDLHVDMMRLTLEIVGKTLLGFDPRGEAERVSKIVDAAMVYMDKQMNTVQGLLPQWVLTPDRYRFRKAVAELDRLVYHIIARCRQQGSDADHLLARLAQARDENGEPMSDVQLRDEAVTMLLAGHETTALTLTYASYLLARHPQVAARLREEIDRTLAGRSPAMTDLPAMPFLEATIKETLRLYPPAYVIGREVVKDLEVGGYVIPLGHQLLMSPYAMHRDARYFQEPQRFDPQRWLEPAASELPRFAYFPFGGGPRVCIGNHFATMEAQLILCCLMQRVELEAVPDFELRLRPIVTLRPQAGLPMRVKRRSPARAAA